MDRDTNTEHQDYAMWTPAFEQLHAAALAGASAGETRRLEAAEFDEQTGGIVGPWSKTSNPSPPASPRPANKVSWGQDFPGFHRFHAQDPFGNRLEFLEPIATN